MYIMPEYKYEHFNDKAEKTNNVWSLFAYLVVGAIAIYFVAAFISQFV